MHFLVKKKKRKEEEIKKIKKKQCLPHFILNKHKKLFCCDNVCAPF
jgi:hypothetical protein